MAVDRVGLVDNGDGTHGLMVTGAVPDDVTAVPAGDDADARPFSTVVTLTHHASRVEEPTAARNVAVDVLARLGFKAVAVATPGLATTTRALGLALVDAALGQKVAAVMADEASGFEAALRTVTAHRGTQQAAGGSSSVRAATPRRGSSATRAPAQ